MGYYDMGFLRWIHLSNLSCFFGHNHTQKIRPFGHDLPPYAVHSFCNYLQFRQLLDITTNQPAKRGAFVSRHFPLLSPLPTLKLQPATTTTPIPFLKTRHPVRQPLTTYTGFFRFYRWEGVGRPRSCSSQKHGGSWNKILLDDILWKES